MACNCGKTKVAAQWRLTMPDGSVSKHGTRRSADLANERKGGGGTIARVA